MRALEPLAEGIFDFLAADLGIGWVQLNQDGTSPQLLCDFAFGARATERVENRFA